MTLGNLESHGGLTREQKIGRLKSRQLDVTTTAANIFSSDVGNLRRHIVGILFVNSDAAPVAISVRKVLSDDTTEDFLDSYMVDAQDTDSVNKGSVVDLDNPLIVLTRSQNLEFDVETATKTMKATIWWYDHPRKA